MSCQITLIGLWAVIPAAPAQPYLRVTGRLTGVGPTGGCPPSPPSTTPEVNVSFGTFGSVPNVPLNTAGYFRAEVPLTAPNPTGLSVSVTVTCVGDASCSDTSILVVSGCQTQVTYFNSEVVPGALTPGGVRVVGFVRGCASSGVPAKDRVTLSVSDFPVPPNPPTLLGTTTVVVDDYTGEFQELVPLVTTVQCDDLVTVTAACVTNPGCTNDLTDRLTCLQCFRAQITPPAYGPCSSSATQPVTLTATISIAAGATRDFSWDFGDGASATLPTINNATGTAATTHVRTVTHSYATGNYQARLSVFPFDADCPVITQAVGVQCDPCPVITVSPVVVDSCVGTTRTAHLDAQVTTAAGQQAVLQWEFGDTTWGPAIIIPGGATAQQSPQSHSYAAPGTYQARLNTILPAGCPPSPVTVTIPECPPPSCTIGIGQITTSVGTCNANGTRTVTATATLTNVTATDEYAWQ